MEKNLILFIFILFLTSNVHSQQTEVYDNPVIAGDIADPSIIKIDDTYYATGTSSEWAPFYPMFKSTDLVNWDQIGHVFNKQPEWTKSSFWAPELFYNNGKLFVYYTARRKSDGISYIGVASTDDPEKEFTDHGIVVEYGTEAIDAFVFEDEGQLYISWKAYGLDERPIEIIGSKLSDDGLRLEGKPFTFLKDTESIGLEGQYHFKKGEYYYIVYSPHSCCGPQSDYAVHVARSKNLRGPYERYEKNPILRGEGDFMSCGHGTVAETNDGRMFYMCHAYYSGSRFFNGRQPILQEMIMTKDHWVEFSTGNIVQQKQQVPFVGTIQKKSPDFEDDFKSTKLKYDWTWNYPFSNVGTKVGKGMLRLKGSMINDAKNGTALCIRSNTPHYSFETKVINKNGSLKGLTLYGDDKNLIAFGSEDDSLIVKKIEDGNETVLAQMALQTSSPYVKMEISNGNECAFYWSENGKAWNKIEYSESIDTKNITRWDRVSRPGLIHIGEDHNSADFRYFKLKNL